MDLVAWWQDNAKRYPTLALIALDVLPIQASSVPCEHLFSSSKQVATDRRACLGSKRFEEILMMKSVWHGSIADWASIYSNQVEEVDLVDYKDLLQADMRVQAWDLEDEAYDHDSDID
jgi:hAT family C-terminal dimerisation region